MPVPLVSIIPCIFMIMPQTALLDTLLLSLQWPAIGHADFVSFVLRYGRLPRMPAPEDLTIAPKMIPQD